MSDEARDPVLCPQCGEENPREFPTCWNCHGDLPEAPATPEEPHVPAPRQLPGAPSALPERRKRITFEVALVILVIWVPWLASGIWTAVAPFPPSDWAVTLWGLLQGSGTLALLAYLAWLDGDWRRLLGLERPRIVKEIAWAFVVFVALLVAHSLAYRITVALGLEYALGTGRSFASDARWLTPFYFALFALIEEVFYRAYLWRRFTELSGRPTLSLLIVSVLFTVGHAYPLASSVSVLFFGLTLACFFRFRPSVWPLVLAHWAFNQFIAG